MRPQERLGLAGEAYLRAISAARRQSTSASWGRLLTAAKNLRAARRDRDRERARPRAPSPATRAEGGAAGTAARREEPSPKAARVIAIPSPAPALEPGRHSELVKEWQRARALREQSHRLVAESRALCAAIATLARAWPWTLPYRSPGAVGPLLHGAPATPTLR